MILTKDVTEYLRKKMWEQNRKYLPCYYIAKWTPPKEELEK